MVLDAYRLARFYHVSPEHFLEMPLSAVHIHLYRTIQLARAMRAEAADDGD